MQRQGFGLQFYCRAAKRLKNGTAPLELAININGVRKFINLPFKLTPEEFHRKRQPKALVDYMALMRSRINEILSDMLKNGEPLTTEALVEYVRSGGYKAYSTEDLFDEFLSIKKAEIGSGITKGVYRKYELVRDLFFEDIDEKKECECQLTHANILKFKAKVEARYEQATAAGYLRKLKSYAYFAIDNGKLRINPFTGVRIKRGEKPIIYLSKYEQRALMNADIENESLARMRDLAVFQMSTGLSYADLKAFRPEDIRYEGGSAYIEKPRTKTGKVFTALVLPEGLEVLSRYGGRLPVISNEKYNAYLKVIGGMCGIGKTLTTHVFRRTYATNLLNSGVRVEVVAAAMGHSTKVCQKHYAQLQRDSIIAEIAAKVG